MTSIILFKILEIFGNTSASVSAIITARDAIAAIADAVSTALVGDETAKVFVIDDALDDDTAAAAEAAGRGDGATGRQPPDDQSVCCQYRPRCSAQPGSGDGYGRFCGRFGYGQFLSCPVAVLACWRSQYQYNGQQHPVCRRERWPRQSTSASPVKPQVTGIDLAGLVRANHSQHGASRRELGVLEPIMRRASCGTKDCAMIRPCA
jgi:succinoglycan biosynthesis protein ExoU